MNNHNGRRHNNNRRFKNNNNQNRRYGGGSGSQKFDDESNNISIQQRKNFANKRDQYLQKAKDALSAGERVDAEGFYQHADHCFRMMNLGLTNGARFDPVRGMIQNPHQQNSEHLSENGDNNASENNNSDQNQNRNQHHSESNDAPQDIGSLPFMKNEAPSGENIERRIIE